jgi:hypothetical protein
MHATSYARMEYAYLNVRGCARNFGVNAWCKSAEAVCLHYGKQSCKASPAAVKAAASLLACTIITWVAVNI